MFYVSGHSSELKGRNVFFRIQFLQYVNGTPFFSDAVGPFFFEGKEKRRHIYIYRLQHYESIFVYSLNHQFIVLITLFMHIGYVVYVVIIIILAIS